MLRFGLVGCGKHAQWVVMPVLAKMAKKCKLVAVAEIKRENHKYVTYPGVATYTDYNQMIAKEDLDALYVATLPNQHYEPAMAGLKAGLHVICEKPMADTVAQCRRMIAQAKKFLRLLAITFESRYQPFVQKTVSWIKAGHVGKIDVIHIEDFWDGHKTFGDLAARRARLIDLSGAMDCGIHKADLVRFYAGGGHWRQIQALGAWFGERRKKAPHLAVIGRLSTVNLVTVNVSMAYGAQMKAVAIGGGLRIVGDKGVIETGVSAKGKPVVRLISDTLVASCPIVHYNHQYAISWMADDFADIAEGRKKSSPHLATGEDGLEAQIFVEQANAQALAKRK